MAFYDFWSIWELWEGITVIESSERPKFVRRWIEEFKEYRRREEERST